MPNIMLQQPQSFLKTANAMLQYLQTVLKTAVAGCKSAFEN